MTTRRGRAARAAAALALVAAIAAAGCGGGGTSSNSSASAGGGARPQTRTLHFAVIAKDLANPAFKVAEKAANERIQQLGGNIDMTWTAPTTADEAQEVQLIESFIEKHVDGLLVDSLGPAVCTAVDEAVKAGVPVVTWDSDCPGSKRTAYVGSDNEAGGVLAGKMYAAAVKGKGPQRIAILTGAPGAINLQQRDQGFEQGLKQSGVDFKIVTRVAGNDDIATSVDAVNSTLRGNSSINGFYFDGPWPLLADPKTVQPVIDAVKSGKLTVVSFDTLQQELLWVTNKWAIGLVGQKYAGFGYQGIQVLNQIVRCHATYPSFVDMGLDVVTNNGPITPAQMNQHWVSGTFPLQPIQPTSGGC